MSEYLQAIKKSYKSIIIGVIGGYLATLIHLPLPWLLGALLLNLFISLTKFNVTFDKKIRDQSIKYLFGELNLNKKFYQLSFGQKKKLQLLLLMLVNKPIWILDDPFNGLDNDTILKITILLSKKVNSKGTIIIASHQNLDIPHRIYELK